METFKCVDCGATKPVKTDGGTGYGDRPADNKAGKPAGKVCYECCGLEDKATLETADRTCLYLTKKDGRWVVTNWPGTLEFPAHVRTGRHNIARTRRDCWFKDHTGREWWGVSYGEWTDIAHCRKLKGA